MYQILKWFYLQDSPSFSLNYIFYTCFDCILIPESKGCRKTDESLQKNKNIWDWFYLETFPLILFFHIQIKVHFKTSALIKCRKMEWLFYLLCLEAVSHPLALSQSETALQNHQPMRSLVRYPAVVYQLRNVLTNDIQTIL